MLLPIDMELPTILSITKDNRAKVNYLLVTIEVLFKIVIQIKLCIRSFKVQQNSISQTETHHK
jgi:hypothetical protein